MRDPAMAADDFRDSSERILNAFVCQGLIQLDERGRPGNVGMEYYG